MDERFWRGIREFNDERFYEAHEVLEDLWHEYREIDRTFVQGLIQLAAGFYHLQCENQRGALSQLTKGKTKLAQYEPRHCEIDVKTLLADVDCWLEKINHASPESRDVMTAATFPKMVIKTPYPINPH